LAYAQSQPGRNITSDFRNGQERHSRDESRSDCEDAGTLADTDREPLFSLRTQSGIGKGEKVHIGAWATEPDVGRVADGVPARVDRLRGLGNAVVPQVAEFIGNAIVEHERRHFS